MKPLIVTNHALEQYSARTGRNKYSCVAELINSIRIGVSVTPKEASRRGFNISRVFKGDTYTMWYDEKISDRLLAIIAKDGAIKTVLRKEMYSYNPNSKIRYEKGGSFTYGYQSPKRKTRRRM